MAFVDKLAERVFGSIISARVAEATLAEEDRWWRSLSKTGEKDVTLTSLKDQLEQSLEAYRSNPLAFRVIELTTDYVLGRGIAVRARDPRVAEFVARFWRHTENQMDIRVYQMCTELSLAGELFVAFFTNPLDGMTYIRLVPASSIDEIETDPDDLEAERRFHQVTDASGVVGEGRWWLQDGMRHYAINRVVGAKRGQGDLVPLLPWLRRYKDWLTDRVVINKFKGAYLWDVVLRGAGPEVIARKKAELMSPPSPGSCIVHNESEEWKAIQPAINAEAVEADGKALRMAIGAGAGVPLHYLSEGESATRATAVEMGEPTRRHYERRQLYFGWLINDVVGVAIARAIEAGALPADVDRTLEPPKFQDLTTGDNEVMAQAAKTMADALVVAQAQGWVKPEEAAEMWERFAGETEQGAGSR
ncbi:MAG: hypothetical protein AB1566_07895 [Chloroflexota bacterium]